MLGATLNVGVRSAARCATSLRGFKHLAAYDSQFGHVLREPLLWRVGSGLPSAGCRVLDEALAVVGDAAGIEAVVEQAVAALGRSEQRRHIPMSASRPWNALGIECLHDLQR